MGSCPAKANSITVRNPASGRTFSTTGKCNQPVTIRTEKIVGEWTWFYKNGEPRGTGGFDDNELKHGLWTRYHPNGQLWDEGTFEHGKKKGLWEEFDENGEQVKSKTFK